MMMRRNLPGHAFAEALLVFDSSHTHRLPRRTQLMR
jgi:hypothetical protein